MIICHLAASEPLLGHSLMLPSSVLGVFTNGLTLIRSQFDAALQRVGYIY